MKKGLFSFLLIAFICCNTVIMSHSFSVPEAYMGFSIPKDWYVFSKNMTDDALLETFDLTAEEVNETLINSDCEYFLFHPEADKNIYLKIEQNDISNEIFHMTETEDASIQENLDHILKNGFFVDGFSCNPEDLLIRSYAQMKFATIPGTVMYDGKQHGMVVGFTFVNGTGICFILYSEKNVIEQNDLELMSDMANSLTFTVLKNREEVTNHFDMQKYDGESALSYVVFGFCGLALVAFCLYFIGRIRKTEYLKDYDEDRENETID